ncbi:MAG: porin [Caldimonas sp.]
MTRRLGFLALLLLLACMPARAQFDYSAYGVLDLSYGRFEPSGAVRENRWNSNSLSASFVGVNAKYGLDGGWTPGINLETFLRFQDLKTGRNDNDKFLSRNAFVSLANNDYGLLRVGRLQSYLFEATSRFNAFGNSIAFSPAVRQVFLDGGLESIQGDFYWDRAISYSTPRIEGVSGNVMYALGRNNGRGDYAGGSVIISRGLLGVSLAAQRVHVNDGIADETSETTYQLGATYNFGWARLFAQHTYIDDRGQEARSRSYTAGASIPLGPGSVLTQMAYSTTSGPAVDRRRTTTSLGYVYSYDTLTDFYVLGSDDRERRQTRGVSYALGVRYTF